MNINTIICVIINTNILLENRYMGAILQELYGRETAQEGGARER